MQSKPEVEAAELLVNIGKHMEQDNRYEASLQTTLQRLTAAPFEDLTYDEFEDATQPLLDQVTGWDKVNHPCLEQLFKKICIHLISLKVERYKPS